MLRQLEQPPQMGRPIRFSSGYASDLPLPPSEPDDRDFYCCGNVHVHNATYYFSAVVCILWTLSAIPLAFYAIADFSANVWNNLLLVGILVLILLTGIPNFLLLSGNVKCRPEFYWPFMILAAVTVIVAALSAVFLVFVGFGRLVFNGFSDSTGKEQNGFHGFIFVVSGLLLACLTAFWYFMLRVIFLDYTFLKENTKDEVSSDY